VTPRSFTLRRMGDRLERVGDVWLDLHAEPQTLADAAARLGS
jgi:hypothetical protein